MRAIECPRTRTCHGRGSTKSTTAIARKSMRTATPLVKQVRGLFQTQGLSVVATPWLSVTSGASGHACPMSERYTLTIMMARQGAGRCPGSSSSIHSEWLPRTCSPFSTTQCRSNTRRRWSGARPLVRQRGGYGERLLR